MFEVSIKKEFNQQAKNIPALAENERGVLNGGFLNFPKSKVSSYKGDSLEQGSQHLKASRFNSFIPFEDKMLGFNAFTQRFLVLDPLLLDLFNASVQEDNVRGLSHIHPGFFKELDTHGFILKKEVDELQKVKDLRKKVDYTNKTYDLTINPTMNCNFKCWYCYETHVKGSKMAKPTLEKIYKHIDHVLASNDELENFIVSWFGGEPMLYFEHVIKPITEYACKRSEEYGVHFGSGVTTNGYQLKEEMIPFFKANKIGHFQITLDGARERHNTVRYTANREKGTYDTIVQNIKLLCKNEIPVGIRINYTQETLETIEEIIEDFKDLPESAKVYGKFSFHNVWQEGKPNLQKLEKIITNFRENGFMTNSAYSIFNTLRDSCYADKKNQATINYNGEVFKCTARDFKGESKEGILDEQGNIQWNEKFNERMNAKFKNNPCLSCRIQPICNGGCSQVALESKNNDYCVVEGSGVEKNEVIMSKFKHVLEKRILLKKLIVKRAKKVY